MRVHECHGRATIEEREMRRRSRKASNGGRTIMEWVTYH